MKKLLMIALLTPMVSFATCQSVYNAMTGHWDYVCTPNPQMPRPPICQQQYDAMNNTWVTVCH